MEASKGLGIIQSSVLSDFILKNFGPLSHLKLQKLLFYVEGLHLAYFDQSIIEDDFEAWAHGPVSRVIYDQLKDQSILHKEIIWVKPDSGISPEDLMSEKLTADQMDLVWEILGEYSKLTSLQLENLSHSEKPWQQARLGYQEGDRCNVKIDKDIMKSYYKSEIFA